MEKYDITVRELRHLLFPLKQDMTIRELREILFNIENQDEEIIEEILYKIGE